MLLASVMSSTLGAKILALFALPVRCHVIILESLMIELAARGHEVTVVSAFPQQEPIANYTDILLTKTWNTFDTDVEDLNQLRIPNAIKGIFVGWQFIFTHCDKFLSDPNVQKLIESNDQHFDLIIYESLYHECSLGFVHKFRAPSVAFNPNRGWHITWETIVGGSAPYSYVPSSSSDFSDRMTFWERFYNAVTMTVTSIGRNLVYLPWCDRTTRRYFNDSTMPYLGDLEKNTSLLLVASHETLDYPKPTVPAMVYVGGIHIRPEKPLPKDMQLFLDGAEHGAILFSFGSQIKSRMFPVEVRQSFVDAFSALKQRVLWSWSGEPIPDLPANVRLEKWLPQVDVLAHPNVQVFICHGGYNGLTEAVYHGVPLLGIPMYADQFFGMRLVQDRGIAVSLDLSTVTNQTLIWALHALLTDPSYRENARQASLKLRDNLQTPLEKAVYWTEYVIRHKGAPHLRVAALDLAWYQYLLLDLIGAILAPFLLLAASCIVWRSRSSKYSGKADRDHLEGLAGAKSKKN